jgi:hypothetical protein
MCQKSPKFFVTTGQLMTTGLLWGSIQGVPCISASADHYPCWHEVPIWGSAMRQRVGLLAFVVGFSSLALSASGAAAPAAAASSCATATDCCLKVDAWITWADGTTTPVTPWPASSCLVEGGQDWTPIGEPGASDRETWVPRPLPNGGGFRASLPTP